MLKIEKLEIALWR